MWNGLELYEFDDAPLVQVLCRVLPSIEREMPRSCDYPTSTGDHAVGDVFVSVGFCTDEGDWQVAGWSMSQDCWKDANLFEVLGWQPLADVAADFAPATIVTVQ